jgi:transketolase
MARGFKKRDWIVILLIIFLLAISIILGFFFKQECKSKDCFIQNMVDCKKSYFNYEQQNMTWGYDIRGSSNSDCIIDATVSEVRLNVEVAQKIEGKKMRCTIPKNIAGSFMPEAKLQYCHGILKEELQDLIIEKMHLYIMQNIGQISI